MPPEVETWYKVSRKIIKQRWDEHRIPQTQLPLNWSPEPGAWVKFPGTTTLTPLRPCLQPKPDLTRFTSGQGDRTNASLSWIGASEKVLNQSGWNKRSAWLQ